MAACYDAERIARLVAKAQESHVQALVDSWGAPTPDDLALVARVFGGSVHHSAPAATESEAA
ncbi:hypothetical protein FHR32_005063 [Streptosporangium album]|uniref:Uncharacterized protein n=1 Tax=Streptosporangium album TaxID=47479 RepID=A0A7W7RYP2_9ACTN|nr:hypothetical protein [Streptosporangium album]